MDDKRLRFETQVLPHLDAAYRFALGLTRSRDDADDLVQEAILRAYRSFETLRSSESKAWLMTIVRHSFLTVRARRQKRPEVALEDEGDVPQADSLVAASPDPESASIAQDRQRALDSALSKLSDEHREVLILRDIEELSYREIAAVTSVPIGTVMSRLARARSALREQWLAEHGEGSA